MSGPHRSIARRRGPRLSGLVKDTVLSVAGLLGVAAVAWLVFAQVTGASIVVLKTGSMAPDMPQGSGALSFPTQAADLAIGDVVTVQLDDTAPLVTHRIVEIDEVAQNGAARSLTLQGDANDTVDLFPYRVESALRSSVALPYAGPIFSALQAPIILGGIVVFIGLLVLWAFWPASAAEIEDELAETKGAAG